jgi:uncharacterized LabA/DUF88 family protein
MMFVDGENLTIRGQQFAENNSLPLQAGSHYEKDVFLWFPGLGARTNLCGNAPLNLQPCAVRSYYYTSAAGDENRLATIREALWSLGFQPEVFKRDPQTRRSKGVDIALAKDFLCNAFFGNYDVAVLIAGDGDYVPMVNEVKRMGKVVYVVFLFDHGLSPALRIASDECYRLNDFLCKQWQPTKEQK